MITIVLEDHKKKTGWNMHIRRSKRVGLAWNKATPLFLWWDP